MRMHHVFWNTWDKIAIANLQVVVYVVPIKDTHIFERLYAHKMAAKYCFQILFAIALDEMCSSL